MKIVIILLVIFFSLSSNAINIQDRIQTQDYFLSIYPSLFGDRNYALQEDFNFTLYGVRFSDSTGMAFNNDDLPMSFDLAQFDSTRLAICGYKLPNSDWCNIGGEITNMTLIPEPATLLLLGFGTVLVRKKQKTAQKFSGISLH